VDDGGATERTEGGDNGAVSQRRRGDGSSVGRRRHEAEEREEWAIEYSGTRSRGRTRGKRKRGRDDDGASFIGDAVGGGWGTDHGGRVVRRGR
jgi:hypothetical protein